MSQNEGELLRALASGVRSRGVAAGSARASERAASSSEGVDFQRLLERARAGDVSSGLPVTIARGADVQLSEDQLKKVAAAADLAQASGASRALVMIDGKALKLDVGVRSITGVADLASGKPVTGVDAVIQIPSGEGAVPTISTPLASGSPNLNASLLKALGSNQERAKV